ncbi:IclR family transcriptional regulator [Ornithinimicrobium avium]|uniref:IclR family transcriptional regulator n=1 Tax=Ornithinimicrobium avium TaxID=2283195 RepID=A0A345NK48_9MICO|nr:IclR family transcriptional regulator [Ornithinimicrobium avium]AXH95406.1 IclR family transcriptional regulator [Ornithinimicrobium avium]
MSPARNDPRSGSAISTMMAVLRCFDSEHRHLGVVEIAEQTGLHKSSVSRLMSTLELERLVERDPVTRRYSLGLGLLSVAGTLLADLDVRRTAYPVLVELEARTHESSSLMVWSEDQALCVEQVPSSRTIKHTTAIGTVYRTTASSSVLALLAHRPPRAVDEMLGRGLLRLQGHGSPAEVHATLEQVRRDGVFVNDGLTDPAEVGVSAPVLDHRGETVAAVLVAAPRYRVDQAALATLVDDCLWAAQAVSAALGYRREGHDGVGDTVQETETAAPLGAG